MCVTKQQKSVALNQCIWNVSNVPKKASCDAWNSTLLTTKPLPLSASKQKLRAWEKLVKGASFPEHT